MAGRPAVSPHRHATTRILHAGLWLVGVLAAGAVLVVVASALSGNLTPRPAPPAAGAVGTPGASAGTPGASENPSPSAPIDVASYLYPVTREAPPIELIDPEDRAFSLASLRGTPTFVFFGYTHCPDVCPATTGAVGLAMEAFGPGARAVFVSVDPERDTTAWLREYVRFLPAGFVALTGTPAGIRAAADEWGVRYARVETGGADAYTMSHTADVYLVDAAGSLRARFPFGTSPEVMTAVLREIDATPATPAPTASPAPTAAPPSATPAATVAAAGALDVTLVSSSVWAGPAGPVILRLSADGAALDDPGLRPSVRLISPTGESIGGPVEATGVRPPGVAAVSYVATLDIPAPGAWRLEVASTVGGARRVGSVGLDALDPGATAPLGAPAPTIRTPTLADAGGVVRAVTTDPAPDLRLSQRSTADALASGQPFVLVVDSSRFKVSPACGRAIVMARYLLDRWQDVAFIHHEPYRFSVVADTPVLDGTLEAPTLTDPAVAWGTGGDPWGAKSMPWVFVVDGAGTVRAKYQGVFGSDDVDVVLALITGER